MDLGLKNRVALLTGATSGIGFACAQALLAEGLRVVVTGSNLERARAAAEQLGGPRECVLGLQLDLCETQAAAQAFSALQEAWGEAPQILVCSTGGPPAGSFEKLTDEQWERANDLVLRGLIRCLRAALPGMQEAGFGRIVAITSSAAREPIDGLICSSTLRAGVSGLVNALSREVGPQGITINAVLPGYVNTGRLRELAERWAQERGQTPEQVLASFAAGTPLGRIVEPSELGALVAFLCSRQAAAINGCALAVDGGRMHSI